MNDKKPDPYRRSLAALLALSLTSGVMGSYVPTAHAQAKPAFPTKPIRLVVGFAAGGPTDAFLRVLAQEMGQSMGQSIVVDNKPGANSIIANSEVARAPADGYTLLGVTLADNVNSILVPDRAKYRINKDFEPIGLAGTVPLIMVTAYDSPIKTVNDAVAQAKAAPNSVTYGSAGVGGSAHLAGALLQTRSGTEMTHVPFKGNAPALSEVMSGRVSFMFYPNIGVRDMVAQKRIRAIGITTPERLADLPDVPTMKEAGFPGFDEYTPGMGFAAPAGTDPAIVATINKAMQAAIAKPEISEKLKGLGAVPAPTSPQGYRTWLQGDYDRWERVIQAAGVKAE